MATLRDPTLRPVGLKVCFGNLRNQLSVVRKGGVASQVKSHQVLKLAMANAELLKAWASADRLD